MIPTIAEFFDGKNVLVTGATGFVGKVLVEKLLRCCGVGSIYLLVRPKAGQAPQQRIQEMVKSQLFDKVREENPSGLERLVAVKSDMLEPGLGLSDEDRKMLQQEVGVVFHVAATVKFDEKMKLSYQLNVKSIHELLKLCKDMSNLEVFVHTSTAFCNCDKKYIEEKIYPPPTDYNKLDYAMEWMDDEMLRLITPNLIGERPNTYTFTKAIGEYMLAEEGCDMPIAIIRPSQVGAVWKDPIPGWIDNYNGPSGVFIACGKGLISSLRADPKAICDIIPVDVTVNAMIGAAWYTAVYKPSNIPIYNVMSGAINPLTYKNLYDLIPSIYREYPLDGCFHRPGGIITKNQFLHRFVHFIYQTAPFYFFDLLSRIKGQKARMLRIDDKVKKAMACLEYFTTHSWQWANENVALLSNMLSDEDREVFFLDVSTLQWRAYLEDYCVGTRKFVLNEKLSELPKARAHIRKVRNIQYVVKTLAFLALWRYVIIKSRITRHMWYLLTSLVVKVLQLLKANHRDKLYGFFQAIGKQLKFA
ncbi:fatty acyl-CoA reductase 1-like [Glandiceps talaboti]